MNVRHPRRSAISCRNIYRSIDQLIDYPRSGIAMPKQKFRRIVTRKYHFKIAYLVEAERIVIIGIFRYQNRIR